VICPKCNGEQYYHNGKRNNKQCYKCKSCGHQYTVDANELESRKAQRRAAVALYLFGLSLRSIGKLFGVHASTVIDWVRNFAIENYEKPTPSGAVIIELDEMWHYLNSKKTNSGSGRLIVVLPANWLTGNAGVVVQRHSKK